MHGFTLEKIDDYLYLAYGSDKPRCACQTTASAQEWERRLIDAGLLSRDDRNGRLKLPADQFSIANVWGHVAALAGYYTNSGNPSDDFRDGVTDNDLQHLPYAALAWIDHEIREWAADHARSEVTWEGEVEGDIHKKAAEIIATMAKRFAHENPACAQSEHFPGRNRLATGSMECTPGETRVYAFGDHEQAPIPLCLGCFHRQLDRDGEVGRNARFTLRAGFLVLDQWEEAEKAPAAMQEAHVPSVTAGTSAALVERYDAAQEL